MLNSNLDSGALALLQQGYRNNWQQYLASLHGGKTLGAYWDICVLTASNARQAKAYEEQLAARRQGGLLPAETCFRVIADPGGTRIGSGGATLWVLSELQRQMHSTPLSTSQRVLIIHSGGDSRRLPHCSATGKLFARVPHELPDGRPSSLFDEFLVSLSGLPGQIPGGVLVASGDVLFLFDHLQLTFARLGVTGVAAATPAEIGTHHGVYVTKGSSRTVHSFLHKPSIDRMRAGSALRDDGRVQIDTGLVWFEHATADALVSLADELDAVTPGVTINLYGDLLAPLAQTADRAAYLADTSDGPATPKLQRVRRMIWEAMRGTPFSVELLHPAVFVHFGTSREYLQVLREGVRLFHSCGWRDQTASWVASPTLAEADEPPVMINSYVQDGAMSSGCLADSCLETRLELTGHNLLSHVTTERQELVLSADLVLDQLPLRGGAGYVTRLFGVDDDPKRSVLEEGTFANVPWAEWLASAGISAQDVWPHVEDPAQRTLWEARLYPICAAREESLDLTLWLQAPGMALRELVRRWRETQRLSLGESYVRADVHRLVREEAEIEDRVRGRHFYAGLEREHPADELARLLGGPQDAPRRARLVADRVDTSIDPWLPMRGYYALAVATQDRRWEERAFSSLARLVRAHTTTAVRVSLADEAIQRSAVARVAARIDFGGGWTDSPPHSLERGGTVLNAAISLWGEKPIVAQAELLDVPEFVLESHDIEATLRPRFVGDILNYANPADPFALHKAAMVFRGIVAGDADPQVQLADLLRPGGHGVRLTTSTSIPRGSGLGTRSTLGGAILKCLADLLGQGIGEDKPLEQARLFGEVLCLEQMITTGGGWQDQIGGLVGGVKLITSQPGLPQVMRIDPVSLTPTLRQALDERLLLVYTGQRRLAKNLLHRIMSRWIARDPEMVAMLHDIGKLAREMYGALRAEDVDAFGQLIARHWEINRRMDPDCANPFIDSLLAFCQPYMVGAKLAGAGGGGFAIVVARDKDAALELEHGLRDQYPQSEVRVWPCRVV